MRIQTLSDLHHFAPEKMTKVGIFDSPRMFCDLYCLEPGQQQAPHTHDASDKIYIVMSGTAVVTIGDEEAELSAGQGVHAAPSVRHGIANRTAARCVVLVFMTPKPEH